MKKFLVVLLSLGLLVAFSATASAVDVQFSGSYYAAGAYENNAQLADVDRTYSRTFVYQRLQLQPVFKIAEGLTLTTRFVALEKQWGQTDWRGGVDDNTSSAALSARKETPVAGNPRIHENFEFERSYVGAKTAIGLLEVGYMSDGAWGTVFGNLDQSRPKIKFTTTMGPLWFLAAWTKEYESDTSSSALTPAGQHLADGDNDNYVLAFIYNWKAGNAGLLYKYWDRAATRATANYTANYHALLPYIKANFGPVYVEGEIFYAFGKISGFESPATTADRDIDGLGAYAKVQMNLGPAYFGVLGMYSQGDDGSDPTKLKMGPGSQDMDVALILGNDQLQTWKNSGNGYSAANLVGFDSGKNNSIMYSIFGGFNPSPKLNLEAMVVSATRDKSLAGEVSKDMGIEFDVTAKYKVYDNLSYMVGAGYLWTGDYFKGTNSANVIGNDYLLMNKLTLSF